MGVITALNKLGEGHNFVSWFPSICFRPIAAKLFGLRGRGQQPWLREQDEDRAVQAEAPDADESALHRLRFGLMSFFNLQFAPSASSLSYDPRFTSSR